MKVLLAMLTLAGVLCTTHSISYAETALGDHDHKKMAGLKGGRLLENTNPAAEFYVENDNTVTIAFYDDAMKPVAATEQAVSVVAEAEGNKATVEFEKKGDVLVSKEPLPKTHALNLVVRFSQTPGSTPQNFRFVYEDHICGTCKRAEYACICGH